MNYSKSCHHLTFGLYLDYTKGMSSPSDVYPHRGPNRVSGSLGGQEHQFCLEEEEDTQETSNLMYSNYGETHLHVAPKRFWKNSTPTKLYPLLLNA